MANVIAVIKSKTVKEVDAIFDWLDECVVDGTYTYNGRDMLTREISFGFDNAADCTLFLLRWA